MKYRYWFAVCKGGNIMKRRLLSVFGSAAAIYEAQEGALYASAMVPPAIISEILASRDIWELEKEYEEFRKKEVSFVTIEEEAYPSLLKAIYDAPYALFYRGTLPEAEERTVAMVGARQPSAYGERCAYDIAGMLAKNGYSVVSGMALGIDGISHQGALDAGGRSYAFLGCGVDICYPRRHRALYERIIKSGAVLSEFPPGTEPIARNFPSRNRLISGLSRQTIVIEARQKSGSLITTDFALEQGRDIYVLPGRITDPLSAGTNCLIAQGAAIICSKESLLSDLLDLPDGAVCAEGFFDADKMRLEKEELLVYSCFDFYAKSIDEVQTECKIALCELISIVMRLCSYGLIRENFKNHYIRIR